MLLDAQEQRALANLADVRPVTVGVIRGPEEEVDSQDGPAVVKKPY